MKQNSTNVHKVPEVPAGCLAFCQRPDSSRTYQCVCKSQYAETFRQVRQCRPLGKGTPGNAVITGGYGRILWAWKVFQKEVLFIHPGVGGDLCAEKVY